MADKNEKKKNSAKPVLIAFAVIVIIMVIANLRSGNPGLKGPVGGVAELKSCGNSLLAVSKQNEIYIWDWGNLSAGSKILEFKAREIVPVDGSKIVRIAADKDALIAENIDTGKTGKEVFIKYEDEGTLLKSSENGKFVVSANPDTGLGNITFEIFDANLNLRSEIIAGYSLKPKQIAITNNGDKTAVTFERQKGFLIACENRDNWKYENSEYPAFNELLFSPDGNFLFVSDSENSVYKFDLKARELVRKFEIEKYKTPANNPQTVTCLAISADGKFLSAASSPNSRIYIWDAESGEKVKVIGTSFFSASGLGFSPDSSKLAISDLTTRGIRIAQLPASEK